MIGVLLVVALVAVAVWMVRATRSDVPEERGGPAVRRFLQYLFLLIALFSGASGVTRVLTASLPLRQRLAGPGPEELALGLSLTIVAAPVWVLLWRPVRRRLLRDPDERASPQWSLYLAIAATTSLVIALTNLVRVGSWAVGADDLDAPSVAAALVWTTVWGIHVALLHRPTLAPAYTRPSLAVLAGSAVGVIALGVGVDGVLSYGFGEAYQAIAETTLVPAPTAAPNLRRSLVLAGLAAAVWWWHWLHQALHGPRSTPWHITVLLVPVLGGLLVAVGSAATALNALLRWMIGDPEATRAVVHLAILPEALAATLAGGWVWWYHLTVVGQDARRDRGEAERAYEYVVAAVGLVASAVGVTIAIVAAIEAVAPMPLASAAPTGRDTIALAATLLLVALPLWWTFWRSAQSRVGDVTERQSSARRTYLFALFGVAGLTGAISVVVILFVVLRDLLEGALDATAVNELRVAIALTLSASGVAAYHWEVLRGDLAARQAPDRSAQRHVLLVSSDGSALADAVVRRTGATVRSLHRLDAAGSRPDADAVAAAILASDHERLLVTVDEDGTVHAIPYTSR